MEKFENTLQLNSTQIDGQVKIDQTEYLRKIFKLQLISKIIKSINVDQLDVENKENIAKKIINFSIQDYLKISDAGSLLGLSLNKEELSYTERRAIHHHINQEISNICTPIINFVEKMKNVIPDIFNPEYRQKEIVNLEKERRELHLKLAELKSRKCSALKVCFDIKSGPYLGNTLELMHANYRLCHEKANMLKAILLNNLYSRTNYATKAVQEVGKILTAKLEEEE